VAGLRRLTALVEGNPVGHGRGGRRRRMANVLKGLRVLQMVRHHGMVGRSVRIARRRALVVLVVILITVLLVHKVLGPLVLVGAAILRDLSARGSFSAALSRRGGAYILVPANRLIDVARRKLVQLLVVPEDDDGHIDGAQHRELMRLLEQPTFALQECAVMCQ
jgi:hypothetical protein